MTLTKQEISRRLNTVDGYAFEQFVAELWEQRGWDAKVTSESNDKGIDVIATRSTPYPEKEIIQAKRYHPSNKVGSPELQQYASLNQQERDADKVIVVCTSGFTDGALAIAEDTNVKCVDGVMLAEMISSVNAVELVKKYSHSGELDNAPRVTEQVSQQNEDKQEGEKGKGEVTLVSKGDGLSAELTGMGRVEGKVSSGGIFSGETELDGIIVTLKLFNQSDEKKFIELLDSFIFKDKTGTLYTPINLGKGEFENGWKKHGGKRRKIDPLFIQAGARVKYAIGVSLPQRTRITNITCETHDLNFSLDHNTRNKIPDLPKEIETSLNTSY